MKRIVHHPDDLNKLIKDHAYGSADLGELKLGEGFQNADTERLEDELNRHYYACGCGTATAFFLLAIILSVIYTWFAIDQQQFSFWRHCSAMLVISVSSLCVGKFIGLRASKNQLYKTRDEILRVWQRYNGDLN